MEEKVEEGRGEGGRRRERERRERRRREEGKILICGRIWWVFGIVSFLMWLNRSM